LALEGLFVGSVRRTTKGGDWRRLCRLSDATADYPALYRFFADNSKFFYKILFFGMIYKILFSSLNFHSKLMWCVM
jgi:hypothetical protein